MTHFNLIIGRNARVKGVTPELAFQSEPFDYKSLIVRHSIITTTTVWSWSNVSFVQNTFKPLPTNDTIYKPQFVWDKSLTTFLLRKVHLTKTILRWIFFFSAYIDIVIVLYYRLLEQYLMDFRLATRELNKYFPTGFFSFVKLKMEKPVFAKRFRFKCRKENFERLTVINSHFGLVFLN